MFVTLTDIQNGEPVYLTRSLLGELEVALCELTYYHLWHNIRGTERVSNEQTTVLVPDGYYNARELDEEVFKPLGAKLHLDTHTGLLQLTTKNDKIVSRSELAKVLCFSQNYFEAGKMIPRHGPTRPSKTYTADEPHWLVVHREVYIHLAELSTSENLTNGQPSTLLRSIPVENEKRGAGRTISFQVLQYKRLAAGPIPQPTISLKRHKGEEVSIRVHQQDLTHTKALPRVALGTSENSLGSFN